MPDQSERPTLSLGGLLRKLQAQVLATRDVPADPAPGEVTAQTVYDEAEAARIEALPRP